MLGGKLRNDSAGRLELVPHSLIRAEKQARKVPSKNTIAKERSEQRHALKCANTFWPESKICCTASSKLYGVPCSEGYSPVLVFRLRTYFNSLSDSNQRAFVNERMRATQDLSEVADDVDLTGKPLREVWMEKPDVLDRRLASHATGNHGVLLPTPVTANTQYVCTKFFLKAIVRSRNYLWPNAAPKHGRWTPSGSRGKNERAFPNVPGKKPYVRGEAKTAHVLSWMNEMKELHLLMPTEDATILPYVNKFSAHANYVLESEAAAGFPHVHASHAMFSHRQLIADESVDEHAYARELDGDAAEGYEIGRHMDAEIDVLCAEPEEEKASEPVAEVHIQREIGGAIGVNVQQQLHRRTLYRYGNPMLGPIAELEESKEGAIASYSLFVKLWRHSPNAHATGHPNAPVLKLRKWMPFAKCDDCISRRKKKESEKDPAALKALIDEERGHIRFVKRERLSYTLRQNDSIRSTKYLSLIIDGADQSDHALPHSCAKSHATDADWKLKLHLMGVIAHGYGAYVYTCPANFGQGHNVTIQALMETLMAIKKEGNLASMPVTRLQLYIILDR